MTVELKEYFEVVINSNRELSEAKDELLLESINSLKEALTKFEETVAVNFIKTNEFRGSLEDLGKNMATRRELEALSKNMSDQLDNISVKTNDLRSRIDIGPEEIRSLRSRADISSGERQGEARLWGMIIGVSGLVGTIVGLIFRFI